MSAIKAYELFQSRPGYSIFSRNCSRHELNPQDVFFAVRYEVFDAIDNLTPGQRCTSADLCGLELWSVLGSPGLHSAIGISVSFLVKSSLVPLVCVTPARVPKKRYTLDTRFGPDRGPGAGGS
jgi:hypothetical protein